MRVCFWQAGSVSYGRVCLKINPPCLKHTTAALYSRCLEYVVYVWFELYLGRVLGYDCGWINLMWIHYANVRFFPVHWSGDLQLDVFEGQLISRRRARACKLDVREAIATYITLFITFVAHFVIPAEETKEGDERRSALRIRIYVDARIAELRSRQQRNKSSQCYDSIPIGILFNDFQ